MSVSCRQCGFENAEGAVFCASCQATIIDDSTLLEDIEPLPDDFEDQVRDALKGKVRIIRELGRGGMAVVYEGLDLELNRKVAVKCLPLENSVDKALVQRFHLEAKMAASMTHPHIVPIYSVGHIGKIHYFTMAYLSGGSLEDRIIAGLSLEESVEIICQVASALEYAHAKNLVHRDIKPSNVMFDEHGNVRVLDFGVARLLHEARLTITRAILGTPEYMSPEQALSKPLDGRADLYSLGTMFYHMVTRTLPFTANEPLSLIYKHVNEKPDPPHNRMESVPHALSRVILKLIQKNPDKRYTSAGELIGILRSPEMSSALKPPSLRSRTSPTTVRMALGVQRQWQSATPAKRLVFGVVPVLLILGILFWPSPSQPEPPPEMVVDTQQPIVPTHALPEEPLTEASSEEVGDTGEQPTDEAPAPMEEPAVESNASVEPEKEAPPRVKPQPKRDKPKPKSVEPKPDPLIGIMERFEFANLSGGAFKRGGRRYGKDAMPAHRVSVSPFSLSVTEVTQELWEAVMGSNPSCNQGQSFPVENVSWAAVNSFITKLNERTGKQYRLPTEAEWEYAAKEGKRGPYGPLNLDTQGWYAKNATQTQPVRGKDPSGVGLFDIHGNVWEWCADIYDPSYYKNSPKDNPTGPAEGPSRVVRGGAFDSKAMDTRPQKRSSRPADSADCTVGFRLAL